MEHIDKAYDDNQILKDFSVEIDSHEMISVIGGSGSGKTTMLKLINGLLLPDQGHVYIDGIDIQTINQKISNFESRQDAIKNGQLNLPKPY